MKQIDEKLIFRLKKMANRKCWTDDDISPFDASGGNIDDAYFGGCEDGETSLAREILDELKIVY